MIVRVWRTQVERARADEYEQFAREISLPMFRAQPGYVGVVMGRDGTECVVVTLWRSERDAKALETSPSYRTAVQQILARGFLVGEQTTAAFNGHLVDGLAEGAAPGLTRDAADDVLTVQSDIPAQLADESSRAE